MQFSFIACYCFSIALANSDLPQWILDLELPEETLPYHIKREEALKNKCLADAECPFKDFIKSKACFGYERGCKPEDSYDRFIAQCTGHTNWLQVDSVDMHKTIFSELSSFERLAKHQSFWKDICTSEGNDLEGSYLTCVDHLAACRAKNFFFDFSNLLNSRGFSERYRSDVIQEGQVGGRCSKMFDQRLLHERSDRRSYLQSWGDELFHWKHYPDFKVDAEHCDVIFERPTVIIKLDAAVNMYHHFCDFVNVYASQHLNGSFSRDIDILWYDTHYQGFHDTLFGATWEAFTKHKPVELITLHKKRVCFKDALLPLLARQRLGLYYNMPVISGCNSSALFRAFNKHILHRLGVKQHGPLREKLRVTLLSRSTQYRRILNEAELVTAMKRKPRYEVSVVDFKPGVPFVDQLKVDLNTDILLSIHGSGLSHLIFLPDWGGVFEIYNCDDERCYYDLARLRGVFYRTWENVDKLVQQDPGKHPRDGTPHKKFTNYSFDADEFMRILDALAEQVEGSPELHAARTAKYGPNYKIKDEL